MESQRIAEKRFEENRIEANEVRDTMEIEWNGMEHRDHANRKEGKRICEKAL